MNRKEVVLTLNTIHNQREDQEITPDQAQFEAKVVLLQFVEQYFEDIAEAYYEADNTL
jgi:hypothetical protein